MMAPEAVGGGQHPDTSGWLATPLGEGLRQLFCDKGAEVLGRSECKQRLGELLCEAYGGVGILSSDEARSVWAKPGSTVVGSEIATPEDDTYFLHRRRKCGPVPASSKLDIAIRNEMEVGLPLDDMVCSLEDPRVLPAQLIKNYQSMEWLLQSPTVLDCGETVPSSAPMPRAAHAFADSEVMLRLYRRMHDIGMMRFEDANFPVRRPGSSKPVANGLFGIPKSDAPESRLITDMRPGNIVMIEPGDPCLPNGDIMVSALLRCEVEEPGVTSGWVVSKRDFDNCFHRYRVSDAMQRFQCLKPLSQNDVAALRAKGVVISDAHIIPVITTLSMGNKHAVVLAQAALLHLIDRAVAAAETELGTAVKFVIFAYIDDVAFLGPDKWVQCITAHFDRLAAEVGLKVKASKSVDRQKSCTVLGFKLDLAKGTLGITERRWKATLIEIFDLINLDQQDPSLLPKWESMLGKLVWLLSIRRGFLSVLDTSFIHLANAMNGKEGNGKRKRVSSYLNKEARNELLLAAQILPLCRAHFQADRNLMLVTDASNSGGGIGIGKASPPAPTKPHQRLQFKNHASPDIELAVPDKKDFSFFGYPFSQKEKLHSIAVRELSALTTGVRALGRMAHWRAKDNARSTIVVAFNDNTNVICCVEKGRANSRPINAGLRNLAAWSALFRLTFELHYVKSADNPADIWSRLYDHLT